MDADTKLNKDSDDFIVNMTMKVVEYAKTTRDRNTVIMKFEKFYEDYPALVSMIIDKPHDFDFSRLFEMLKIREKVKGNNVSYKDASLYVGQKYYDEFVAHKVNDTVNKDAKTEKNKKDDEK